MEQPKIIISADCPQKELGDLFGIFFEDLNHAGDGGLYGEMIQNRSFEFDYSDNPDYTRLTAWRKIERGGALAEIHVEKNQPINSNNENYLVIEVNRAGNGAGIQNQGFNSGISLTKGESYLFSCYYRRISSHTAPIRVCLENSDGTKCYGEVILKPESTDWTRVEFEILSNATDTSARLSVLAQSKLTVALDMVSLFPKNTFKGRRNGLRSDIAEMLEDMKPRFLRFPGGCLIHCGSIDENDRNSMYRWKNSIGPVEARPTRSNRWKYNQTFGLGYFEYFLFCEDIGAKPMPVIPAGVDPHTKRVVPMEEMQPWIDDALDLIEFANGGIDTEWGAKRAELGHPEPFNLEYLAIGNEEVGIEFFERYEIMHHAVREKYPEIKLIISGGLGLAGSEIDLGWKYANMLDANYIDVHYYPPPEWFLANMHYYNEYPEEGPKVFIGEYASSDETYYNAIVEAAYMIGLEKAPGVGLASYAPLLCNVDYVNWNPNLIWFNNHMVFGTPSYYVQKLFMRNQGDVSLRTTAVGLSQHKFDSEPIIGEVSLKTKNAHVDIVDIHLENLETGETKEFSDVTLTPGTPSHLIDELDWTHYMLSFRAKKMNEDSGTDIYGKGWFGVDFGMADKDNGQSWIIDGYMNMAILRSIKNGRIGELMSHAFSPEAGRFYKYRLEVNGRKILTYIDDVLIADAEDKQPVIEKLYYSASLDKSTGEVIIKAVNLQEHDLRVDVTLEGLPESERNITVISLSDYLDDDRNSFDHPTNVVPKVNELKWSGGSHSYLFPKKSLTVIRVFP